MKEKSNNIAKFTAVDILKEKGEIAMFCAYCGKENPNGATFCCGCGKPLAGAANAARFYFEP